MESKPHVRNTFKYTLQIDSRKAKEENVDGLKAKARRVASLPVANRHQKGRAGARVFARAHPRKEEKVQVARKAEPVGRYLAALDP